MVQRIATFLGAGSSSVSPNTSSLPAHQAGDVLVAVVGYKPDTAGPPNVPAGWTRIRSGSGGTGSTGSDVGPMGWSVYAKVSNGAEPNPTFSAGSPAPNVALLGGLILRADSGEKIINKIALDNSWVVAGADTVTTSPMSATATEPWSSPPRDGDTIVAFWVVPTDNTGSIGNWSITCPGLSGGTVEFGTTVGQTHIATSLGNDGGIGWAVWSGFTGTATGAPSGSFTGPNNSSGAMVFLAIRDLPLGGPNFEPVVLDGTSDMNAGFSEEFPETVFAGTSDLDAFIATLFEPGPIEGTSDLDLTLTNLKFWTDTTVFDGEDDLIVRLPTFWNPESSTGKPAYRLVVVDRNGTPYAELDNANIGSVKWHVTEMGTLPFNLPLRDPKVAECLSPEREVQLWRGAQMLDQFVIVRGIHNNRDIEFQCRTLDWYFTRRVVGEVPRRNLLKNGGFENGFTGGWDFGTLPPGPNKLPARAIDTTRSIKGTRSLMIAPSSGREKRHLDNDTIYSGTELTNAGKTQIRNILNETFGDAPRITVEVYDDNTGSRTATMRRAEARLDSVVNFIADEMPDAFVWGYAYGYKRPRATNSTASGRNQNRRTTFGWKTEANKRGHKQYASQTVTYRNPASSKRRVTATATAWCFIEDASGYAAGHMGLVLVRSDPRRSHKKRKWRQRGFKRVLGQSNAPLSKDVPVGKWARMETSLEIPPTGKDNLLTVRLFPPNGTAYWDEVWLTVDEALHYTEDEQADILRDLVTHAQDPAYGKSDLGITLNVRNTGVKRDRTYLFSERQTIYDLLAEWPTLHDGMEWAVICGPDSRVFTSYYPRRGKDAEYVLALGANVATYSVASDSEQVSTTIIVQHEGEGSGREEGSTSDATVLDGLVLEKVYTATPGSSVSSLDDQAQRGLERYKKPIVIPELQMNPEFTTELLNELELGDRVLVDISDEWMDMTAKYRITSMTLDPKTDGISYEIHPEDTPIEVIVPFASEGWKYLHQDQVPITGDNNTLPTRTNQYADENYDDSGWTVGKAAFGWRKEGTKVNWGGFVEQNTIIPDKHELWMRREVKVTSDMIINIKVDRFAFIYINGHLLGNDWVMGHDRRGRHNRGPYRVPQAWLNPNGIQQVTLHVQNDFGGWGGYGGWQTDILVGDMQVRGVYDPLKVVE